MTEEEHLNEFLDICVAVFHDLNDSGQLDAFLRLGQQVASKCLDDIMETTNNVYEYPPT